MSGEEIISRLHDIVELLDKGEIQSAKYKIGYLTDDIYMYKQHSL